MPSVSAVGCIRQPYPALAQALLDADKALKLCPGWSRLCAMAWHVFLNKALINLNHGLVIGLARGTIVAAMPGSNPAKLPLLDVIMRP